MIAHQTISKTGSNAMLLLRTPAPLPRESLLPYVLRLSVANGYATPGYFMTPDGVSQFLPTRSISTDQLSRVIQLTPDQVQRLRYTDSKQDPSYGRLLGMRVSTYDLRLRFPRVCPECIQQNGHVEAIWDLAWVTCCPVHQCELLEKCPECGDILSWSRGQLNQCKKGHELNQAPLTIAPPTRINFARLIAWRVHGPDNTCVGDHSVVATSDAADLTLYEICRLASAITNRIALYNQTKYIRGRSALSENDDAMSALGDLFFGSLQQQEAVFDRLCLDEARGGRHMSFHTAFQWITHIFNAERAKEIKIVSNLMSYAKKHWPASRIKRLASVAEIQENNYGWISPTETAKAVGLKLTTVTKGIKNGTVPHRRTSEKASHCWLVPTEWVKAQAAVPFERIDMTEVRRLCGMNSAVITELRQSLQFVPSLKAKSTIIRHDVNQFVERLLATTEHSRSERRDDEMDFHELMKGRGSNAGKVALVVAVLNGTLIPTGKIRKLGINGLLFDERAARRILWGVKDDCPMQQADIILDCHNPRGLLQMGMLERTRKVGDRVYVSMRSVMAFRDKYASPTPLLKTHAIQIPKLLKVARMTKIDLLQIPNTQRGGNLWFIPRSRLADLERAIPLYRDLATPKKYRVGDLKRLNSAHALYAAATAEANACSVAPH